jgi:hypothetical protein
VCFTKSIFISDSFQIYFNPCICLSFHYHPEFDWSCCFIFIFASISFPMTVWHYTTQSFPQYIPVPRRKEIPQTNRLNIHDNWLVMINGCNGRQSHVSCWLFSEPAATQDSKPALLYWFSL